MIYHAFKHYFQNKWEANHTLARQMDGWLYAGVLYMVFQPIHAIIDLLMLDEQINEGWVMLFFICLGLFWQTLMMSVKALFYSLRFYGKYEVIDMAFGYRAFFLTMEDQDVYGACFERHPLREEKIIGSACLTQDGMIWAVLDPGRHHHCLWFMAQYDRNHEEHQQGFITNQYRYLDRTSARMLALSNGQCKQTHHDTKLFSEDLWATPLELQFQG